MVGRPAGKSSDRQGTQHAGSERREHRAGEGGLALGIRPQGGAKDQMRAVFDEGHEAELREVPGRIDAARTGGSAKGGRPY